MQQKFVNLTTLKEFIEAGVIQEMYLVPFPMQDGYSLIGRGANGTDYSLQVTRGEQRRYASVDTAINGLKSLGWRNPVTVHLD